MKKSQIVILIASIIIIGGIVGIFFGVRSLGTKVTVAPEYELQNVNGTSFFISSLQPKVVLLDFMSLTCIPCLQTYPILGELYNDTELQDDVEIISVNLVTDENVTNLIDYAASHDIIWTLATAPEGMQYDYGVLATPTFVIIDSTGNITYSEDGVVPKDELKEELIKAIEGTSNFVGITIYQDDVLIGLFVLLGFLTFFSPCAFPLMPSYVGHILGMNQTKEEEEDEENQDTRKKENKRKLLFSSVLGLTSGIGILISYVILGSAVSAVGDVVYSYFTYALPVMGGILIIFGILMFTKLEFSFSRLLGWIRKRQVQAEEKKKNTVGSKLSSTFLYGLGYGIASIGCNGIIFIGFAGALVTLATSWIQIFFAYLAFALTIIVLMIGTTLLISVSRDAILHKLKAGTDIIKKLSGVILVGVGIYLLLEFFLGG
ncbi:MAG: redoxin family protein [Candidatus Heimdallarchaeaceae archaeon]